MNMQLQDYFKILMKVKKLKYKNEDNKNSIHLGPKIWKSVFLIYELLNYHIYLN